MRLEHLLSGEDVYQLIVDMYLSIQVDNLMVIKIRTLGLFFFLYSLKLLLRIREKEVR